MEKPLLTLIVASYNQEKFIREAVAGALAQTYSPLEIIISDDGSKDRTFEVAQEAVANYKGPHTVRFNRNSPNLGIGGHVNRVMELARGELVIAGAGDDVSLPDRAEVIYQAWEASGRRATSIFSSYETISETGKSLGFGGFRGDPKDPTLLRPQPIADLYDYFEKKWPVVVGCTHAWSPKLFEYFGPIRADLEDLTLSFRTLAIGELLYVHKPLIKYRRHGENVSFFADWDDTSSFEHRERRLRWTNAKHVAAYDTMLGDLDTLQRKGRLDAAETARLKKGAQRMRDNYATELSMMEGNWKQRWQTVAQTARRGNLKLALRSVPRAVSQRMYRQMFLARQKYRTLTRAKRRMQEGPE